jgi:tRNA-dihydrouridine synthase B
MLASPFRLGPLVLDPPVLSAPVAGFTDAIFRGIVRHFGGCGLIFTEMVSAGGWIDGSMPPDRLAGVEDEPRPLGVQLWDRDPDLIFEAARRLAAMRVSVVDLNFGCPKKRIMGKHAAGATLMRDPATVGRLVAAAVRGAGAVPVTAKIRLGPSLAARTAIEVAAAAEANGAVAVTVHGRTADEHYGVPCRYDLIAEVVRAVTIPVVANGDVRDAASALHALRASGAAGVMVARECLTRPWVFREITAALRGEPIPPPPSLAEQRAMLLNHHAAMVAREGDRWGTVTMRKFAVRYLTAIPGARPFRDAIARAEDGGEFRAIVERFFPADGPAQRPRQVLPLRPAAGPATSAS